jgi:hypothetical protein
MTTLRRSPALYALMVLAPVLFIVGVLQLGPTLLPSLGMTSLATWRSCCGRTSIPVRPGHLRW